MTRLLTAVLFILGLSSGCAGWDDMSEQEHYRSESSQETDEMIAIQAEKPGSYYLVDQRRGLCLLQEGEQLRAVDCRMIREAAYLLGQRPENIGPKERLPNPINRAATEANTPSVEATDKEITAFEGAYSEILCKSRAGTEFAPQEVIATHGLTAARYTQLEGWLARQKKRWAKLRRNARSNCGTTDTPTEPAGDLKPTPADSGDGEAPQ